MGQTFNDPGKVDPQSEAYTNVKKAQYERDITGSKNKGDTDTKALEKEQYSKPKSELEQNAGKNIAKGQSQYGMYNNRDYSKTLKLARMADTYNSKPQEHLMSVGTRNTGGIKDLGTGYERPELQTMETRAMDQALQLDTNQKQLAQALQDAVNHKDLNAFIQAYQQRYGIALDRYKAELTMNQWARQQEMSQMFTKSYAQWQNEFGRYFSDQTSHTIFDMVRTDPQYAAMLSATLGVGRPPAQYEQIQQDFVNEVFADLVKQGVSEQDAIAQAERTATVFNMKNAGVDEFAVVQAQKWKQRRNNKKLAKQYF
jgi:hypothetical protein